MNSEAETPSQRDIALIVAIKKNDAQAVQTLLERGANPNGCDRFLFRGYQKYRSPALHVALRCVDKRGHGIDVQENVGLVAALLDYGADVHGRDTSGDTPLHLAACTGKQETVRLLLDRGADINAQDRHGQTALMVAVTGDFAALVQELLERGADIDRQDNFGLSALMYAVNRPHLASLRVLLDWEANVDLQDRQGRSALSLLDGWSQFPGVAAAVMLLQQAVRGQQDDPGNTDDRL
jgi:serine/threonine-protein phosphatase 6 regulatory ankyrin repeat subunit B